MKIQGTQRVGPVGPLTRARKTATSETSETTAVQKIEDTVSVLGIPPEEMTPRVQSAIMQLVDEVNRLRDELTKTQKRVGELSTLADEDTLVPAANRRAFVRELTRIISFSERYGAPCSLLYFDLNDLKKINDELGHAAGDAALTHFANSLSDNVRDSDIVGRVGGDEFAIILLNSDDTAANAKAEQIQAYLQENPLAWGPHQLTLHAAHGVYSFRPGVDASTAIAEADRAMYERKKRFKEES